MPLYFLHTILGISGDVLGDEKIERRRPEFLFIELEYYPECGWMGMHEETCSKSGQYPFRTGLKPVS